MPAHALLACHECDLLQRETPLPPGGIVRCRRCGAELYRNHPNSLDRALAYTLGAIVLFAVANTFPLVGLKAGGQLVQTTLFGGVRALYAEGMWLVAGIVFLTTIVTPLTKLAGMAYLLLPLKFNRVPRWIGPVYRTVDAVNAWSMVEVFMLGLLVALVKLAHIASVVPGIALWSFGALMLLLSAVAAVFDPREMWAKAGAAR
jgi:paraquat-inducible protein A